MRDRIVHSLQIMDSGEHKYLDFLFRTRPRKDSKYFGIEKLQKKF